MFTPKNLFSSVLCPHRGSCLLPRCIFKHTFGTARADDTIVSLDVPDSKIERGPFEQRKKLNIDAEKLSLVPLPVAPADERPKKRKLAVSHDLSPLASKIRRESGQIVSIKTNSASPPQTSDTTTPKAGPKNIVRPSFKQEALNPRATKLPAPASHDLRYRLLRALYDQFVRLNTEVTEDANNKISELALPDQALITKALDIEEEATASPSVYSNLVKNKILVYKRMSVTQWIKDRETEVAQIKATEATPCLDSGATKPRETSKPIETGLSLEEELEFLPQLQTDVTNLSMHGYVTVCPTAEEIELARKGVEAAKGWEVCDRCKSRFEVFPGRREEDGALTSGGQCTYHFGKSYFPDRSISDIKAKRAKKYRCCGETLGDSPGCTTAPCHVFKISEVKRLASILNYQTTPLNPTRNTLKPVCMDGEMGYTVYGLELIRLTATTWPDGQDLFDVLVRPMGLVLDLNSRYSGVYPEDMADAPPWTPDTPTNASRLHIVDSPSEARSILFSYLSPSTPLIGHGLENDLNAIRMIHPTIIDTALLFPHRTGLPCRNSLKMLAQTHLNRQIQVIGGDGKAGHDSKEDANAAGELVRYALKVKYEKARKVTQLK